MLHRKLSITEQGGLEPYVNAYLASIGSDKTYQDYLHGKDLLIGGEHISKAKRAKDLGLKARSTIYQWDKQWAKEHEDDQTN